MTSSSEKRVLITGASSGIGRATSIAFAQAGYSLALVSRSVDKLTTLVAEIEALGGQAALFPMDLSEVDQVRAKMSQVVADWGPADILVNCAGMGLTQLLRDTPLPDWQAVLTLNLTSPFQCIQAVLPSMRARGKGTVINVISVAGRQVFEQWGAYAASKHGLMALTKTLALEERGHGIQAIAFCPGPVNTALWDSESVDADFDRAAMLAPEDVAQSIVATAELAPRATIEELVLVPSGGTF